MLVKIKIRSNRTTDGQLINSHALDDALINASRSNSFVPTNFTDVLFYFNPEISLTQFAEIC